MTMADTFASVLMLGGARPNIQVAIRVATALEAYAMSVRALTVK